MVKLTGITAWLTGDGCGGGSLEDFREGYFDVHLCSGLNFDAIYRQM